MVGWIRQLRTQYLVWARNFVHPRYVILAQTITRSLNLFGKLPWEEIITNHSYKYNNGFSKLCRHSSLCQNELQSVIKTITSHNIYERIGNIMTLNTWNNDLFMITYFNFKLFKYCYSKTIFIDEISCFNIVWYLRCMKYVKVLALIEIKTKMASRMERRSKRSALKEDNDDSAEETHDILGTQMLINSSEPETKRAKVTDDHNDNVGIEIPVSGNNKSCC